MSERNTVAVKIYGQEYNISGETSREHIMRVADYVDSKMQEIGDAVNTSNTGVAVLAAVNIADEYFGRESEIDELKEKNDQLVSDTQRYALLWEEAKQSLAQYKEEMAGSRAQQEENLRTLTDKNDRIAELTQQLQEVTGHNEVLRARCEELTRRAESAEAAPEGNPEEQLLKEMLDNGVITQEQYDQYAARFSMPEAPEAEAAGT